MSYFGRVVELPNDLMANYKSPINTPAREFAERVLSFHKAAVSSAKDPVRSVQKYPAKDRNSEGFSYQSVFEGDLSNFSRQDIVFHTRREPLTVFKMTYTGGILVTPDWP
ncbi:MAG: hypothetical protein HZA82_06250 [Thaumarchaeota archaeon]|nr:hypothetical protein [Nitrososphaerota archaeon]